MLEELHLHDVALIEDAWLELGPGLTVLTGETGTGKTVLLSAFRLLMGQRADATLIRTGADEARVEGRFVAPDGTELLVARTLAANGRNRCLLDGAMATVGTLSERIGSHIDLHGQHDHQALLRPATHGHILDAYGGARIAEPLAAYQAARAAYRAAAEREHTLEEAVAQDAAVIEANRLVLKEIERVAPLPDEDSALEAQLPALSHAEEIAQALHVAHTALLDEGAATDAIGRATAALDGIASFDPVFEELRARLAAVGVEVADIAETVRSQGDGIEHDPARLDAVLSRLSVLDGLKKRFGPTLAAVCERRDDLRAKLAFIDDAIPDRAHAHAATEQAAADLTRCAAALTAARTAVAADFTAALETSIEGLLLDGASFEVAFEALPFERYDALGADRIEFLYRPTPDAAAHPLAKIASGGEISRVMLALKSVIGSADTADILVFDEIDTGIGGVTAQAVGERLKALSATHQVIVVTHLAQVAVYADAHFAVRKRTDGGAVATEVAPVEGEERVHEIARLLSGEDSEVALAHARELWQKAQGAAATL